jgi:hypothetical protein
MYILNDSINGRFTKNNELKLNPRNLGFEPFVLAHDPNNFETEMSKLEKLYHEDCSCRRRRNCDNFAQLSPFLHS